MCSVRLTDHSLAVVVFLGEVAQRVSKVEDHEDKGEGKTDVSHDWHGHESLHDELEGENHVLLG